MASFSVTCPKISHSFPPQFNSSRTFLAGSPLHSSLGFQISNRNQYEALRVSAQLNAVSIDKSETTVAVTETNSDDSSKNSSSQSTIPDAASISAYMNQVADLVKLVDSRDIVELQLKQENYEVLIRKKEALTQLPAAPYVLMQSPSPQPMVPPQLSPAKAAPAGPTASPPALAAPPTAAPKSSHPPLKCPMAGTFYRCPSPGAPPFVKVGDKVQKGQVICIIEAMKLMNDIEADHAGTVVDILAEDGKPVSVDLPLFVIEP